MHRILEASPLMRMDRLAGHCVPPTSGWLPRLRIPLSIGRWPTTPRLVDVHAKQRQRRGLPRFACLLLLLAYRAHARDAPRPRRATQYGKNEL